MTPPTQGEIRAWARTQNMTVNARGSLPTAVRAAYDAAHGGSGRTVHATASAAAAGPSDLAAGLRTLLDAIDAEVRTVSSLSTQIDKGVADLNALRDEQAKRLLVLDELQAAADDTSLAAFLNKAVQPRKARVPEIIPERLQ